MPSGDKYDNNFVYLVNTPLHGDGLYAALIKIRRTDEAERE